jgi:hypothetical protein
MRSLHTGRVPPPVPVLLPLAWPQLAALAVLSFASLAYALYVRHTGVLTGLLLGECAGVERAAQKAWTHVCLRGAGGLDAVAADTALTCPRSLAALQASLAAGSA